MKKQSIILLDILGISTASLCLFHCLLFPVLTIIPLELSHNHWIDVFFACIGMFVVSKILLTNTSLMIKIILGISILLVMVGVTLELLFELETFLVLIGGMGMILGHFLNYKSKF